MSRCQSTVLFVHLLDIRRHAGACLCVPHADRERDHLVTVVFPELRERVEQLGLEFFDVDLRWGVAAKDANGETANSWEYCRQWIDRVEPFFVCILGQRYGWVPKSSPDELLEKEAWLREQFQERKSVTAPRCPRRPGHTRTGDRRKTTWRNS